MPSATFSWSMGPPALAGGEFGPGYPSSAVATVSAHERQSDDRRGARVAARRARAARGTRAGRDGRADQDRARLGRPQGERRVPRRQGGAGAPRDEDPEAARADAHGEGGGD